MPPVHGFAEGPEHVSSTLRGYPPPPLHGFGGASGDPAVAQARSMDTDALLPADPLLPSEPGAGALAAQERLALDSTSLWLNRLGEELVAWLKTLASAAVNWGVNAGLSAVALEVGIITGSSYVALGQALAQCGF